MTIHQTLKKLDRANLTEKERSLVTNLLEALKGTEEEVSNLEAEGTLYGGQLIYLSLIAKRKKFKKEDWWPEL